MRGLRCLTVIVCHVDLGQGSNGVHALNCNQITPWLHLLNLELCVCVCVFVSVRVCVGVCV